jgi:dihydroxy-acid dehydratase
MVNAAIGGSTNAVLHLLAVAGRVGVELGVEDFDQLGGALPLLVDLMPSGRFLMEQFAYAGGLPALVERLSEYLRADTVTVTDRSLLENCAGAVVHDDEVIRPRHNPVQPAGSGTAVLRGNLAPGGAVIKQSAAEPRLLSHTGPALVFDSIEDYLAVADDPDLDVTPDTVLVVRYAGPVGYPGMPEVGNFALPKKVLDAGVRDMVRISDARMSGTAYGACVLHVAPEAAVGGPLALVRTGDLITLDTPKRLLHVHVDGAELDRRRATWTPPPAPAERGWVKLYRERVLQADRGVDLDFLVGCTTSSAPRAAF